MSKQLNICIVFPNKDAYSETFIRNHVNFLPGNIFAVYGPFLPEYDSKGVSLSECFFRSNPLRNLLRFFSKLLPAFLFNRLSPLITGLPKSALSLHKEAFKTYLINTDADVVLAEFMLKGVAVMDVCEELNIPLVVHTHGGGDIIQHNYHKLYEKEYLKLFNYANKIISVDSFSTSQLFTLGLPPKKVSEIRYGINLDRFQVTKPSVNGFIFFGVGRFTDKKAPYLTILAFNEVQVKYSQAKLILAGTGELLDCCIQLVKALNIEDKVTFPGILTNDDVSLFMHNCRAFVQHSIHTSYSDSEGTPVAIIEAMAKGLPVISTKHNGISDIIEHEYNGLLSDEHDYKEMARNMIRVIEDPDFADAIGNNARVLVENNFSIENVIGQLSNILEGAVKEHH